MKHANHAKVRTVDEVKVVCRDRLSDNPARKKREATEKVFASILSRRTLFFIIIFDE